MNPITKVINSCQGFLSRLSFLLGIRPAASHNHLDEEIQFHIDQSIQANIAAGMSPGKARHQALVEFGGIEKTREETWRQRPGWLLETLRQDARYALRGFRRNPAFTITVIATLALGIGATTAVFSVVDPILFRALPYANSDRLVSVGLTAPIVPVEFTLGGSYYVWKDNQKPFESITSETGVSPCDLTERNPARLSCASVEASFLPTLGIHPLLGRNFLPEEDRPNGPKAALITYSLWRAHYAADPAILNRLIDIDGTPTRVIGILPRDFEMPTLEAADILIPQALDEAQQRHADGGRVLFSFARLKPGLTTEQARTALEPLFQYSLNLAPAGFRKEIHLRVRSLRDRQMQSVQSSAWILLGAVLAVLLIACTNVASLMMARGASRDRELAVRSALGASQSRLARQTLTEALLLSAAGAAAGWVFAELLLHLFVALAPAAMPFLGHARLDLRIAAFTLALACLCGIAFGILAALQRPRSLAARSSTTARQARSGLMRRTMVVTQIAISMVLLSASTLLVRSFWNLQNQNLGITTQAVLTAGISLGRQHYDTEEKQIQFFTQAEAVLRRLPGVTAVALTDSMPPAGFHRASIFNVMQVAGRPSSMYSAGTGGMVAWRWVTPDYFRALNIPILAGRNFTEAERTGSDSPTILSHSQASRKFPDTNPIGQRIKPSPADPFFTVIGIAADVKNEGLNGSDEPEYYRLRPNHTTNQLQGAGESSTFLVETSLPPAAVEPWIRAQIAAIDPTVPLQIETLSQRVSKLADAPRFASALLAFFAFTGLGLALVGLYGLTVYMAQHRTQEIGIRMALGATRPNILRLIAWEGLRLVALGSVIGVAAALAVSQALGSLLFNISPRDPASLIGAALLLAMVALAATLIPAQSAMHVEPVEALRCE